MTTLTENKQGKKFQLISPVLTVICLAIMFLLNWFFPLAPLIPHPFNLAGLLFSCAGLAFCYAAQQQFKRVGANLYPFTDPRNLVTGGLFRLTRNPMYLGLIVFLTGVWVLLGTFSPLFIVAAFTLIADRWYIAYEEKRLRTLFGKTYEIYQANTPRWI